MPIQIWTDANLPARLKAQGGQALAAGIAGAGQSIGAALEKAMEEKKRLAQQGKAADAFFKSLPEGQTPMSPEDWALRSPREKVSVMTGLFEAQGYQKAQAELGRALEEAAMRKAERENERRRGLAFADFGTMGQMPEQVPSPFSNEEFARRTAPPDLMAAFARAGATPQPEDLRFAEGMRPQPPRGLPRGQIQKVPGGTLVGTGENYEPNFVPDPKPEEPPAPNFDWLIAPDDESFQAGLQTVGDPKMRDKVLETRRKFQAARYTPSFNEAMAALLSGKMPNSGSGASSGGGKNPTVTTKAQFDALPSGTIYTGKDGKRYRKP